MMCNSLRVKSFRDSDESLKGIEVRTFSLA